MQRRRRRIDRKKNLSNCRMAIMNKCNFWKEYKKERKNETKNENKRRRAKWRR